MKVLATCVLFLFPCPPTVAQQPPNQQGQGSPSIDDLQRQLTKRKAANSAAAARDAGKARVKALNQAASHLIGHWQADVIENHVNEQVYTCVSDNATSYEYEFTTLDSATGTLKGRRIISVKRSFSWDPDGLLIGKHESPSNVKLGIRYRADCLGRNPYRRKRISSLYLQLNPSSTLQLVKFVDDDCSGSDCGALDQGNFDITVLENGQAEIDKLRLKRN